MFERKKKIMTIEGEFQSAEVIGSMASKITVKNNKGDYTTSFMIYNAIPERDIKRLKGNKIKFTQIEKGLIFKDVMQELSSSNYNLKTNFPKSYIPLFDKIIEIGQKKAVYSF